MNEPWWQDALRWALFPILMALVMGGVAASRAGAHQPGTLRQPISVLLIGAVCILFFGGLLYAGNTFAHNETMTVWVSATFASFALLGVPFIWIYFTDRHTVSASEFNLAKISGARKSIRWSDVVRLNYSHMLKWFHVEDRHGAVARVSIMLIGLPEFAALALRYVPPNAIDAETREVLQETSQGRLPPI